MSGKLRIVLGVLVLAAAGSVIYLFPSLTPGGQTAMVADQIALKNSLGDSDHDGLIDRDETYWRTDANNPDTDGDGFLDGEEVLTGHNPLVKGPNDYVDPTQNATERIRNLTIGGMMAGDLDPKSPNYEESVKMLADEIANLYGKAIAVASDKLIVVEDTEATKTAYVRAISAAFLKDILPATTDTNTFFETYKDIPLASRSWITDDPQRYTGFVKEARRLSAAMETRALKVLAIPVPQLFESQHAAAVQFLRAQQQYYGILSRFKEDPSLGSAALGSLIRVQYEGTQNLMYDFASALSIKIR